LLRSVKTLRMTAVESFTVDPMVRQKPNDGRSPSPVAVHRDYLCLHEHDSLGVLTVAILSLVVVEPCDRVLHPVDVVVDPVL